MVRIVYVLLLQKAGNMKCLRNVFSRFVPAYLSHACKCIRTVIHRDGTLWTVAAISV